MKIYDQLIYIKPNDMTSLNSKVNQIEREVSQVVKDVTEIKQILIRSFRPGQMTPLETFQLVVKQLNVSRVDLQENVSRFVAACRTLKLSTLEKVQEYLEFAGYEIFFFSFFILFLSIENITLFFLCLIRIRTKGCRCSSNSLLRTICGRI
jgi:hypothetical protein